ncbi:CmcI family methyltransferase [Nonomuraea sp. KM88]|uniref:CmcI family methyltransferase n=1 Tax=Nonomuraea sp. KM88 TaxID=3457427 RepID=UPI003FCDA002
MSSGVPLSADEESMLAACGRFIEDKLKAQGGVPTFHDNDIRWLLDIVQGGGRSDLPGAAVPRALKELGEFAELISRERYQDALARLTRAVPEVLARRAVDARGYASSQGITACPSWGGLPLFKTVYDSLIYPTLISELRPGAIIELGSGSGGSALWFADITSAGKFRSRIVSVDIHPVGLSDERIDFVQGDLHDIQGVLDAIVPTLPHPWLVIEDAHVNVSGVLSFFDRVLEPGDYLVVEDSLPKRPAMTEFLRSSARSYALDARYADMFGENCTCATDSILVCR